MERVKKPVKLTLRALKDLDKVNTFYAKLYGDARAEEIIDFIFDEIKILESTNQQFTKIGAIDESFSHLKYTYRKLIIHHCKITYREGKNHIYIVRIFDTRQHPNKNK